MRRSGVIGRLGVSEAALLWGRVDKRHVFRLVSCALMEGSSKSLCVFFGLAGDSLSLSHSEEGESKKQCEVARWPGRHSDHVHCVPTMNESSCVCVLKRWRESRPGESILCFYRVGVVAVVPWRWDTWYAAFGVLWLQGREDRGLTRAIVHRRPSAGREAP